MKILTLILMIFVLSITCVNDSLAQRGRGWRGPCNWGPGNQYCGVYKPDTVETICGWVCPIGTIQELFHQIPLPKKLKVILPFIITNPIRTVIFLTFIAIVFTAGIGIYGYFNPFHFLHWRFGLYSIMVISIMLIASVFMFRPFCYLICPVGLFTWVLEHFSLFKVKVNKDDCKECDLCIKKSACPAVQSILDEKWSHPDCFACGRCIGTCPKKALGFTI